MIISTSSSTNRSTNTNTNFILPDLSRPAEHQQQLNQLRGSGWLFARPRAWPLIELQAYASIAHRFTPHIFRQCTRLTFHSVNRHIQHATHNTAAAAIANTIITAAPFAGE